MKGKTKVRVKANTSFRFPEDCEGYIDGYGKRNDGSHFAYVIVSKGIEIVNIEDLEVVVIEEIDVVD